MESPSPVVPDTATKSAFRNLFFPFSTADDPADSDNALDGAGGDDNAPDEPRDDQLHYHAAVLDLQASPFEFRVLEVALDSVCSKLEHAVSDLERQGRPAVDRLTHKVSIHSLEEVKRLKGNINSLMGRVQTVRDEIQRFLDDDSDMRDMYLTRKAKARAAANSAWLEMRANQASSGDGHSGLPSQASAAGIGMTPRAFAAGRDAFGKLLSADERDLDEDEDADIQELEDLLETYFTQVDNSYNRLQSLKEYVYDTEDYVNIDQDAKRNNMLEITVLIGFGVIVHGVASCVYGIFGMNFLLPTWPDPETPMNDSLTFDKVSWAVAGVSVALWFLIVWYAKRARLLHYVV